MMPLSLKTQLLSNFSWLMLANLITGGINFAAMAWFALKLGPAAMGEYALIVTTLQLIAAFLSAGFDQAVIRDPECRKTFSAASFATIAQAVLLTIAGGVAYAFFYFKSPEAAGALLCPSALMLGSVILSLFGNLFAAPIAARLNYRYLSHVRLFATLAGVGSGMLLVLKGAGIYALVWRELITVLGAMILYRIKSPLRLFPGRTTRSDLRRLMRFSSGMWGLNLMERVIFRLDYALVGAIFGKELLGMYFVLRGLVEGVLSFLIAPIQTVLYTYYCRLEKQAQLSWPIPSRAAFAYWAAVSLAAVLGGYLSPVITLLLGEAYKMIYVIVPSLVLYAGSVFWFENAKVWFMAQQLHQKLILARSIQFMVLLATIYPLALWFQILGASIATAMGALSLAAMASYFVNSTNILKAPSASGTRNDLGLNWPI